MGCYHIVYFCIGQFSVKAYAEAFCHFGVTDELLKIPQISLFARTLIGPKRNYCLSP